MYRILLGSSCFPFKRRLSSILPGDFWEIHVIFLFSRFGICFLPTQLFPQVPSPKNPAKQRECNTEFIADVVHLKTHWVWLSFHFTILSFSIVNRASYDLFNSPHVVTSWHFVTDVLHFCFMRIKSI